MVSEKKLFEWEDNIPPTCRTCMNAKYIIGLAAELYRLRRESDEIRIAAREAMRRCGARSTKAVGEWLEEQGAGEAGRLEGQNRG